MLLLNEDDSDDEDNILDKPIDKTKSDTPDVTKAGKTENQDMIFKVVSRPDLIAGYLGQTAIKTQKVIDSCLGGILFIDEAYSLGSEHHGDSYAKECIDTINLNLTEKKINYYV